MTEEFPFGKETLVFKVMGKMFTLADAVNFESVNLKCEPETGMELIERYTSVSPGYHMNKKHWITVEMDDSIPDRLLKAWIGASYDLVVGNLSKSELLRLQSL